MNFNDYQKLAKRTSPKGITRDKMANFVIGLNGESGEVAELFKKHLFHGHVLNKTELEKELGDVIWYVANLASLCRINLDDIAAKNIEKLKKRYPGGFSKESSVNRVE